MKDDSLAALFLGVMFAMLISCLFGYKLGTGSSYDNCINYYSDESVVDARAICKKIVSEGKK